VKPDAPVALRHHLRYIGDDRDGEIAHLNAANLSTIDVKRQDDAASVVVRKIDISSTRAYGRQGGREWSQI